MSVSTTDKHPKYYFEDGNIVLLTSDKTLFRLHKCILRPHSTLFNDMFKNVLPPAKDEKGREIPVDGSSDEHPIVLDGSTLVTVNDPELESICAVLYDMPLTPASKLDVEQAVALLRASCKLQFAGIYSQIVQMLDEVPLQPTTRYQLATECLVDSWIIRCFTEFCSTVEPIPPELVADFVLQNESKKLSALIMIREGYRTRLLVYAHGSQWAPDPSTSESIDNTFSPVCKRCLPVFKQLLLRILQNGGLSDLDGADATKLLLLEDRMLKGIQPRSQNSLSVCTDCRAREKAAVAQVLGTNDLIKEVKKAMHMVS